MKIAIAGCAGRMGHALIEQVMDTTGVELVAGSVRPGSGLIGQELGTLVGRKTPGIKLVANPQELFDKADAVIDFTRPDYSLTLAGLAGESHKILVCGTTGFSEEQLAALKKAGAKGRVVWSANMSVGVNLLSGMIEKVAGILPASEFDIEIDEMHHRLKADAPSGTALLLGEAAARGRKVKLKDVRVDGRSGQPGARKEGAIGFSVRRGGDVVGDHTVTFAGSGERLELAHKASSRDIYASGALRAALWAKNQGAGFYSMRDVLGI